MESTILYALYEEYKELYQKINELSDKLNSIGELIKKYGGEVPSSIDMDSPIFLHPTKSYDFSKVRIYPSDGTWKEKILYALQSINKPATAGKIAEVLSHWENKTPTEIVNTVTQYCSAMAISGEIDADKSSYRNQYFLKQ